MIIATIYKILLLFTLFIEKIIVSFYLKTSLPFRYYGTSIRVADVIEIIGILFLSYSITCKKVDGDIV